ncbi:FYVE, RhoGEF and PH domain-containing protein 6 [Balamuthia mandrillaris]
MDAALEIMAKEISYISALTTLVNCYLKPLRQARASEQTISAIFGNVELILEANKKFLEKLKQSSKSWNLDGIRLGPVIDEFLPWLTLYADYCANYPHSQAFIRKKGLQSEKLAPFFQNELAVKALLIKPVQKIPQYMVMFERLLRWTDKDHEDYAILQDALLQIRRVAEVVDETVGLRQALAKLRDVMSKLTGNVPAGIMCGDNVFVKDGMMTKQCRKAAKQRYVLLLSGMLLYGIKELHKYRIRHYILLSDDVQIEKFVPIPDIPAKGLCNAFEVTGKTKSFILWCSTAQQKDEWIEALATAHSIRQQYQHCLRKRKASMLALKGFNTSQEVISPSSSPTPAVSPSSSSASLSTSPRAICHPSSSSSLDITVLELSTSPVWDPDNFRDTCPICELRFTVRRRRHHCRACGGLVCDRCSPQRCYVTALGKSARVCVNCCPPTSSSPT